MQAILLVAIGVSALALAGCGGDESSPEASTTDQVTTVETTPARTTETTPKTSETAPAKPKPKPEPTPRPIVIVVDQGRPRGGIKRPKLEQGEKVVLVVRADAGEALHIHGYDVEKPITPGEPLRVPLTATIPGRFEVELHHPDSLLAVLEVRP
ncbi:MAG TPA: hypothetical protein VHH57_04125 [Gaiella sp.]|nr:hypothetical protein [Gaiella sp.]